MKMQEIKTENQSQSKLFEEEYFQVHSPLMPNGKIFKITRTSKTKLIAEVNVRNLNFLEFVGI